jgi:hypothetical protein
VVLVEDWVVMQPVQARTPNTANITLLHKYGFMVLDS